jgi:Fe-S oxidoreductase
MFPDDADVKKVQENIFDPFEYLMLRHKAGKFDTRFKNKLGKIAYHIPCHQRVQKIGMKTRDIMQLVPDTEIQVIDRCSGHDGTYAVKSEFHEASMKICRPITNKINKSGVDHYVSDCPMAGHQIENGLEGDMKPESPFGLLKLAYGLES